MGVGGDDRGSLGVHGRRAIQGIEQVAPQIDREVERSRVDGGQLDALPFGQLQIEQVRLGGFRFLSCEKGRDLNEGVRRLDHPRPSGADGPKTAMARWGCQKFRVRSASVGFVRSGGMAGTVAARAGPPRACRPGSALERGYEAISLTRAGRAGRVLPSFPPFDSPLRLDRFFKVLYRHHDERNVVSAPNLAVRNRRLEWSPDSPAFESDARPELDYGFRRAR